LTSLLSHCLFLIFLLRDDPGTQLSVIRPLPIVTTFPFPVFRGFLDVPFHLLVRALTPFTARRDWGKWFLSREFYLLAFLFDRNFEFFAAILSPLYSPISLGSPPLQFRPLDFIIEFSGAEFCRSFPFTPPVVSPRWRSSLFPTLTPWLFF